MQKTVLIISYFFPPMGLSGVVKAAKTAKYLASSCDWHVIVLTATPKHYYAYDESLLQELIDAGVHIYSTPSKNQAVPGQTKPLPGFFERKIIEPIQSRMYFPDSAIKWRKIALAAAETIVQQYQPTVLLSFGPPISNFVITDMIAERYNIPFVLEYLDSWTRGKTIDNQVLLKSSKHQKLEEYLLKRTARIVVPTRTSKEQLIKDYRFLEHDDIMIMPPGYDSSDIDSLKNSLVKTKKCRIVHAGMADNQHGFHEFLSAFASFIKKYPEAASSIQLCLPGLITQATQKMLDKYGLMDFVDAPGYIQHKDLFQYLADCTVLMAITDSMYKIPSKVYEYIGIGRPLCLIAPAGSVTEKFGIEHTSAFVCTSNKQEILIALLNEMYLAWKHDNLPTVSSSFTEQFNYKNLAGDLSVALTKAIRF